MLKYLEQHFPEETAKWDHSDYRIWSPLSLDDLAEIEVHLINDDRSIQKIIIAMQ